MRLVPAAGRPHRGTLPKEDLSIREAMIVNRRPKAGLFERKTPVPDMRGRQGNQNQVTNLSAGLNPPERERTEKQPVLHQAHRKSLLIVVNRHLQGGRSRKRPGTSAHLGGPGLTKNLSIRKRLENGHLPNVLPHRPRPLKGDLLAKEAALQSVLPEHRPVNRKKVAGKGVRIPSASHLRKLIGRDLRDLRLHQNEKRMR